MEPGITNQPVPVAPVEVRFTPEAEDRVALCMRLWDRAATQHRQAPAYQVGRAARRLLLAVVVLTAAAFVLFVVFLPDKLDDFFVPYAAATGLLILLQVVLLVVTGPGGYFRPEAARGRALEQARRLVREQGPHPASACHLVLTPQGLLLTAEVAGEKVHRETAWPAVADVDETEEYVFFFERGGEGLAVPRRAFADVAALHAFAATARAWHQAARA